MRVLAKQSRQSLEVQNKIAEYRLRVERKKGEWLEENLREPGETDKAIMSTGSTLSKVSLSDIGLSRDDSSKAQRIAKLSNKQFEEVIEYRSSACGRGAAPRKFYNS